MAGDDDDGARRVLRRGVHCNQSSRKSRKQARAIRPIVSRKPEHAADPGAPGLDPVVVRSLRRTGPALIARGSAEDSKPAARLARHSSKNAPRFRSASDPPSLPLRTRSSSVVALDAITGFAARPRTVRGATRFIAARSVLSLRAIDCEGCPCRSNSLAARFASAPDCSRSSSLPRCCRCLSACGYNTIPTAEEHAKAAWSEVLNQYQRRADLIPNLVETVKGYATHERETLEAVVEARAKATQVNVSAATPRPIPKPSRRSRKARPA